MIIPDQENITDGNENMDVENSLKIPFRDSKSAMSAYRDLISNEVGKVCISSVRLEGHILFIKSKVKRLLDLIGVSKIVDEVVARQRELTLNSPCYNKCLEVRCIDKEKDPEEFEKMRRELIEAYGKPRTVQTDESEDPVNGRFSSTG